MTQVLAESGRADRTGSSALRSVARSGGTRLLVLPVSAVLGIVNTRLIIENYGTGAYAQYGLLVTMGSLIPFADLGMSAAVMNAVAASDDPGRDDAVRRVLTTAVRVLVASMVVLTGVSLALLVTGAWPALLGRGLLAGGGVYAATLCAIAIAISIPAGLGQRVLAGLGRNHVSVAILGLQTPVVLAVLLLLVGTHRGGSGTYLPVVPYVVTFGLAAFCTHLAARRLRPALHRAIRDARHVRTVRGGRVLDVAWPMLLQMIALPIAMQTDRIVVSHVASDSALAQYNLGAQLYAPVWAIVSSAGVALWPIFARARATGTKASASPMRMAAGFAGAAAGVCAVLTVAAPWLVARASGGAIRLPTTLLLAFAVFMVLQAAKYPLGMYLTDSRGLRFQALMIVLFLPVNLGLSIVLAARWGAVGPVIGSAVGVFCCQVLANYLYVRRELRRMPDAAGVAPGPPATAAAVSPDGPASP